MSSSSNKFQSSVQLFSRLYDTVPNFEDVFDEETWYIFVAILVVSSLVVAFFLSRFFPVKESEW